MTQTDIKRVLAYSTLSQLGYMFAALGVGAFTAAIFHLMTHGFFKGLLFLGSGSVIHAVHDEQDMRKMGGLRKKIPQTYWTMLIGAIAISGIPPLAGFFSKDEILGESFKLGFQWVWAIGIVVAVMTAFYMFRLIGMTFWGESRVDKAVEPKIHESPRVMTAPLWLLAIPSIVLGAILAWPGPPLGPLFGVEGEGLLARLAAPDLRARRGAPGPPRGRVRARRHRRHPDPGQHRRGARPGMLAAWRLFGVEIGPLRGGGRPRLVAALTQPAPLPVPRVGQQVVVRRHQPPAVRRHRRAGRRGDGLVRPQGRRRHRQRHRRGHAPERRRAWPGSRRAASRTTRSGIALGLIAMAGSYFVILGR